MQPSEQRGREVEVRIALVCAAGLVVSALVAGMLASTGAERDRQRFEANARAVRDTITDRVETSIALLRGAAGLLASQGDAASVDSFRAFMQRVALREHYPGILGIGYSARIAPAQREATEQKMRSQGHPQFRIWPAHARAELHSIVFLEPLDERNRAAVGYDMFTQSVRRAAMEQARDTGRAAASGIVELVQEIDEVKQPGFLIYLPVYRGGSIPESVEARRERLLGFAYAPIRAGDFLASAFSQENLPQVAFAVYQGAEPQPVSLLYRNALAAGEGRERFRARSTIDVAGQPWTFEFASHATLAETLLVPILVGAVGVALTLLLALLLWREAQARVAIQSALESERAARSQAERANRMKDEFLATLSHELRTPLNAIVGWAAVLRRGALGPEEMRAGVEAVDRNARAQAQLIDDLLDMNSIVSGKLRIDARPLEAATVLEHAVAGVRPAAEAKSLALECTLAPGPFRVRADPARLQQVMWNLLANAIKFTPPGGRIQVTLERSESRLRLSVADSGEGIDPGMLHQIFERFMQADGSISRRHGGLGLGLAIVRELVELHGGSVSAHSAGKGKGARFVVELPMLGSADAAIEEGEAPHDVQLDGLKVLVVEDEADTRELARVVLEQRRAQVRCAGNAAEALDLLQAFSPDVLLSDIGLPGMDGYELLRAIRRRPASRGGQVPAIAFTAYAQDKDRHAVREAGYQAHLVKPVRPEQLVAAVAALARGAKAPGTNVLA